MDEGEDYPNEESGKLCPAPLDEWKTGLRGNIFGNEGRVTLQGCTKKINIVRGETDPDIAP